MPSQAYLDAAFANETSEAFLHLVTIDHPDLAQPIRVAHDTVDVTSRGNLFVAFPFNVRLPDEGDDKDVVAHLSIDNVDRQIGQTISLIETAAIVTLEVILASDPETVEISISDFKMRNVEWDAGTVSADLVLDSLVFQSHPKDRFDPANFPALF